MIKPILSIKNLRVSREGTPLLHDMSVDVPQGEIHMIMGPNGSGKSTLLNAVMGSPQCLVERGTIYFDGNKINNLAPYARARLGLFMTFQNPVALAGVPFAHVIQAARESVSDRFSKKEQHLSVSALANTMLNVMNRLNLDKQFMYRSLNDGFSGGEKKKAELVQLALLKPSMALIDEIDSGLDIDAIHGACALLNELRASGMTLLVVTHNPRLIDSLVPDKVHILIDGRIVGSGDTSLAEMVFAKGYEMFIS